jgi:hypothetical protein
MEYLMEAAVHIEAGGKREAQPTETKDLMLQPADGLTGRRMGFVSGLTLVGCGETESRTKAMPTWLSPYANTVIRA